MSALRISMNVAHAQSPTVPKLEPQISGNVGLYYCCYDLIAYSEVASRFIGVQVKPLSKRAPVPFGTDLEKCMGDFWIIVNKVATAPTGFILLPAESRSALGAREARRRLLWLQPPDSDHLSFRDAWSHIGNGTACATEIQVS